MIILVKLAAAVVGAWALIVGYVYYGGTRSYGRPKLPWDGRE